MFKRDLYKQSAYSVQNIVGRGCFGVVYKAVIVDTTDIVAIKRVPEEKKYKNRELELLIKLNHPNIIYVYHAFTTKDELNDGNQLNVVTDYMPDTIWKLICRFRKRRENIPMHLIKLYSWQMMRALAYLQNNNIAHRDIKPDNILLNSGHIVKICDFGSAKELKPNETNIS